MSTVRSAMWEGGIAVRRGVFAPRLAGDFTLCLPLLQIQADVIRPECLWLPALDWRHM
jgi:hypothetical protein